MSRYLIDTNVVSETSRPKPDKAVLAYLDSIPLHQQFMSVMTIAELQNGIERCEDRIKRSNLISWMEETVLPWFKGRILPIDFATAVVWGKITARHPKTLAVMDSFIAATALTHDMKMVTRDDKHFKPVNNLVIINPWEQA